MTPFPESEYPSVIRGKDKRESQRLLAAAPDLLDACKYLLENAEAEGWSEFMLESARAAIAKAEGVSE